MSVKLRCPTAPGAIKIKTVKEQSNILAKDYLQILYNILHINTYYTHGCVDAEEDCGVHLQG